MKLSQVRNRKRQGFTLVELLIVIFIIGILVSLIAAAIFRGLVVGGQTRNRVEISQLELAIGQFKQRFNTYPPSMLILCETYNEYFLANNPANAYKSQLHQDSLAFISKLFPNMNWGSVNNPINGQPAWQGIDWNGNTVYDAGGYLLEGDQCLVFCLGGIPAPCDAGNVTTGAFNALAVSNSPPGCIGFAADPKNPANPQPPYGTGTDRIGPFYEFKSARLVLLGNSYVSARSTLHYSYLDSYGSSNGFGTAAAGYMPYAYFSSYKAGNAYNLYATAANQISDCPTLSAMNNAVTGNTTGIWPYANVPLAGAAVLVPPARYENPNSFQIISAGRDQIFGSGSVPIFNGVGVFQGFQPVWTSGTASLVYAQGTPGYDDQSNFHSSLLGASN